MTKRWHIFVTISPVVSISVTPPFNLSVATPHPRAGKIQPTSERALVPVNGPLTFWQVVAAYLFAVTGGSISTSLQLTHKPLCALISLAAGTLLGVTLFAILPESLSDSTWWAVALAAATGYALFFFISKYVHHVCPACAASHFDADATRHFSEIATALIVALAIHSTTDGLALGIQQEAAAEEAVKWSLFSALCIHKVPEGLALGSLLIGAGLQRSGALGWVAAVDR